MELHQLEAFVAVAPNHSFTRAAEVLHLTQPAVTRQIATLERDLKTKLFDRLGRIVQLTPSGETLLRYAERVLHLADEARAAVADIETGAAGRLLVGASSTLATYLLPNLLAKFREAHPRIEIGIHTGVSAHIRERIRAGESDVGLVTSGIGEESSSPDDTTMTMLTLSELATCIVLPPTHPLASLPDVEPLTLLSANLPLLLMEPGTNLRGYADALLGSTATPAMELDNVETIKRMIAAGLGISLLPEIAVRTEVAAGTLIALPISRITTDPLAGHTPRRIELIYRRDKYLSAALRRFIALLQAEASGI